MLRPQMITRKEGFYRALTLLILLLAFALRLYRLGCQDIWWDEGRNIDVAGHDLASIATLPQMDIHPPLYFYLLHLWMRLTGQSEFATRYLSLTFALLTIPLFFRLGKELLSQPSNHLATYSGLLAALIAALSPFYIAESQETRMYTMAIFLSCGSVYWLYRAWQDGRGLHWASYILASAMSIYTHYSAALFLLAQNVFLALMFILEVGSWRLRPEGLRRGASRRTLSGTVGRGAQPEGLEVGGFALRASAEASAEALSPKGWKLEVGKLSAIRRWMLSQVGIALLYLPHLPIALGQMTGYRNPKMSTPTLGAFLSPLWQAFNLGLNVSPEKVTPFLVGMAIILTLGSALWLLTLRKEGLDSTPILLLATWLVLPSLLYYVILQSRPMFHPRYLMLITPPYYLLLAYALWAMWRKMPLLGGLGTAFILLAFAFSTNSYFFNPAYFKDDTRGLARFIESQATADDIVLIDVPYPFHYYYKGQAPAHYLFVDIHTVAERLTELCQGRKRLFFIQWRQSDTDPRGAVLFLLDKYGQRLDERGFRGYKVAWYQLPQEGRFRLASSIAPLQANFGDQISLVGYAFGGRGVGETSTEEEVEKRVVPAGEKMWLVLQWQLRRQVEEDYKVAVYLRDSHDHLVGQDDRMLINDIHAYTSYWGLEEVVTNVYSPPVAIGTPPGRYNLEVAVYSPDTLRRLDLLDERGNPQGTTVNLGAMRVIKPSSPPPLDSLTIQHPLSANLGEGIKLLGYDLEATTARPGEPLPLTLYWQAIEAVDRDYTLRLQLRDEGGQIWGEWEGQPGYGAYPTSRWERGEIVRDRHDLTLAADLPAGPYQLRLSSSTPSGETVGEVDLASLTVQGRERHFTAPPIQRPQEANLGHRVKFLGYDLRSAIVRPGETLHLTLYWQALAEMDVSYTVFTHLLNENSLIWGQKDGLPGGGSLPTTGWVEGEVIIDEYDIIIKPDAPPGEYVIEVGMYDATSGQRLPVFDAEGQREGDRILLDKVEVKR